MQLYVSILLVSLSSNWFRVCLNSVLFLQTVRQSEKLALLTQLDSSNVNRSQQLTCDHRKDDSD